MNKKSEKETGIGDTLKRLASLGVGAAFMTEDAIKSVLSDVPLPKDIINGLLSNAKNAKEDFVTSLREELRAYFSKIDLKKLTDYVLENYDVEVNASLSFKKKKKGVEEKVKDQA